MKLLKWIIVSLLLTALNSSVFAVLNGAAGGPDPSRIIKCGDKYYWYYTGGGIHMKWAYTNAPETWYNGPDVFRAAGTPKPLWWTGTPYYNANAWCPDIIQAPTGEYRLYYAVSVPAGSRQSAIGLATATTLNTDNTGWTDRGIVFSTPEYIPHSESTNAIDPCPVFRTTDNVPYLVFGSYGAGIKMIRLTPDGTRQHPAVTNVWTLAKRAAGGDLAIEAAALYPGVYNGTNGYWLYVNWGAVADYEVRVGWSTTVQGPYYDRNGNKMNDGYGTQFMKSTSDEFPYDLSVRRGRGHLGIIEGEKLDGIYPDWVSYTYALYDVSGNYYGQYLGVQRLGVGTTGWPFASCLLQYVPTP